MSINRKVNHVSHYPQGHETDMFQKEKELQDLTEFNKFIMTDSSKKLWTSFAENTMFIVEIT